MADHNIERPVQRTVPAAHAPHPAGFPSSVFSLGASAAPTAEAPAAPADTRTHIERAMDYIREYGEATREELASAIGIGKSGHIKSFLKSALADGRIVCAGDVFRLGTGKPEAPARHQRQSPTKPRAKSPAAAAQPPQRPAAQISIGDLGMALDADGSLFISANGHTVALTPDQARVMRAFGELLGSQQIPAAGHQVEGQA